MSLLSLFYIDALFYALYMSMSFIAVSVASIIIIIFNKATYR